MTANPHPESTQNDAEDLTLRMDLLKPLVLLCRDARSSKTLLDDAQASGRAVDELIKVVEADRRTRTAALLAEIERKWPKKRPLGEMADESVDAYQALGYNGALDAAWQVVAEVLGEEQE